MTVPKPFVAVVDDDEAIRQSVGMLLEDAGYDVRTFADAASFLETVATLPDGPVITDVRMPGLSGVEMMGRLTSLGQQDRPVIVITGHANVPLAVSAMRAGAFDFLEKPFDAKALLEALESIGRSEASTVSDVDFTPREKQVADGVLGGLTSKRIAQDLGISYRTVQVVRARLLKKTGATNTAALTMLLVKRFSR